MSSPAPLTRTHKPHGEGVAAWVERARSLGLLAVICSVIAGFLAMIWGGLTGKLVYSFSIGLSCWTVVGGLHWAADRWRRRAARAAATHARTTPAWLETLGRVGVNVVGVLVGGSIGLSIADALTGGQSPPLWDWRSVGSQVTLAVTILATVVTYVLMHGRERLAQVQAQAESARRAAAEAELRLLQSQLEPHMLFNTLANLRVLIGLDTVRAQAMLDRLIAFLRSTLAASRVPLHPLSAEFARLDDYLALMAVRMGPRLTAALSLPPALKDAAVPPLLLQPLVENAIRHGLEPAVDGGRISVRAHAEAGWLTLEVIDTGVGLNASPHVDGTRFGLQQVRERLKTMYGDEAHVELATAPDGIGTRATLTLPLTTSTERAP